MAPCRKPRNHVIANPPRRYTVLRNCMPNARVIRMTVVKLGLPLSDNALHSPSRLIPMSPGQQTHVSRPCDVIQGGAGQAAVARVFSRARCEVKAHIFLCAQMFHGVPSREFSDMPHLQSAAADAPCLLVTGL